MGRGSRIDGNGGKSRNGREGEEKRGTERKGGKAVKKEEAGGSKESLTGRERRQIKRKL